ncbi:acyltransferase family protein [Geodermatophilus sabuli]|uniref:Peptidoglycan/LPS O-acetylase OafA/YrhL, contains acyltransferase and SGNH-hydrolase domains n=1 Tax=Geodermatophilus sabuli TaxID=1564158 RepID=A0A285ECM0_9ACTN|nr:acyltransferase [Geodermatophilus sabuli]MBB3084791.1 peptidoglycan/LPS O-acetylase OafA/YrhL [Geodermatophilus sabuli]SNX95801.1 Peptidoglycan/LPS O-acetylase OafA/YrhL, contains acyltransferase and SGNH-hydrolase domains [Geodermatophilus sabuli]
MTVASPSHLTGGEIRSLTGLRIVAALWVVVFHFSFTPGDTYTRYWEPLQPLVQTGALGVDLFYVLSGFVITLTYLDKTGRRPSVRRTVAFWWARVCRIWPVYAVVTTLFGGWMLYKASRVTDGFIVWQHTQPTVDLWHYLQQLLMVQLWGRSTFDGSSWVGAAWSISAEWLAYVVFPLAVLVLWRLRNAHPAVTGALAVGAMLPFAYTCFTTGEPYFPWSWALRIGAGFLAGALTCLAVRRIRVTPWVERVAAGVAVLAVVEILVGLWWGHWRGQGVGEFGGVVVLLFPVLVGALALSRSGLSRVLATGPMVHGGRISYSLYLVHIPVFEVFWTHMGWTPAIAPGSGLAGYLIPQVLLVTVVLAHLCHRYLEEPARLFLRHRGPGRWARADRSRPSVQQAVVPQPRAEQPVPASAEHQPA